MPSRAHQRRATTRMPRDHSLAGLPDRHGISGRLHEAALVGQGLDVTVHAEQAWRLVLETAASDGAKGAAHAAAVYRDLAMAYDSTVAFIEKGSHRSAMLVRYDWFIAATSAAHYAGLERERAGMKADLGLPYSMLPRARPQSATIPEPRWLHSALGARPTCLPFRFSSSASSSTGNFGRVSMRWLEIRPKCDRPVFGRSASRPLI